VVGVGMVVSFANAVGVALDGAECEGR
jgi:hypothetical protein